MKSLRTVLLILFVTASGSCAAALNRLAVVPASPETTAAADVLTAEFSRMGIELLERSEVDKIYREQAIAASGRDILKLGQVLGADGVLILELAREGEKHVLSARLAAVRPGVVLRQRHYPWPLERLSDWGSMAAAQFRPLLPKLGVLPKDALPVSVLNLRSAVRSPETEAMERDLTLLVQNRLVQQPEIFLLERRRLRTLAEEKEQKLEQESPFWSGSYLFEGTIDRTGFSAGQATVNARLVPPAGAAPIDFEVVQPRTNLVAMADGLVHKILEVLRRTNSTPEWKPVEEAPRYYEEAKWALKWKMYPEAQAAADSAWALGKQDMDCALVRVKSYVQVVPPDTGGYVQGSYGAGDGRAELLPKILATLAERYPSGLAYAIHGTTVDYTYVEKPPDPKAPDHAAYALSLYDDFSRTLSPTGLPRGAPWYALGVEALEAAARVLEHFHFVPEAQPEGREKLAEVRRLARAVARWLSQLPSVRNTYWVGDRAVLYGELIQATDKGNIFPCTAEWGCFWQEKPEDTVALYRELMSSPAFAYIHQHLWKRPRQRPLFAAWNEADGKRASKLWSDYLKEVDAATNAILRLEGKFLEFANPFETTQPRPTFQQICTLILSQRGAVVSNSVDVLYLDWSLRELVDAGEVQDKEQLRRWYAVEIRPKLQAMREEHTAYARRVISERKDLEIFEKQRRFLADLSPFVFREFSELFRAPSFSKAQAAELRPLVAGYKSNLLAQAEGNAGVGGGRASSGVARVGILERQIELILNPPAAVAGRGLSSSANPPLAKNERPAPPQSPLNAGGTANALLVNRYFRLPVERLDAEVMSQLFAFAHRWRDGRLWFDLRYEDTDANGMHLGHKAAAAAWEQRRDEWLIVQYPMRQERAVPVGWMGEPETKHHFEVFENCIYLSDWDGMKKYDLGSRRWETLTHPGQKLAQLFAVNGHLYAANEEGIYEILDGGRTTRVLASCRRRPTLSLLDSFDTLGPTVLFPGPAGSLRAAVGPRIYSWSGRDWSEAAILRADRIEVCDDATLLHSPLHLEDSEIWLLPHDKTTSELCWLERRNDLRGPFSTGRPGAQLRPQPTWSSSNAFSLAHYPSTAVGSNLCFFLPHSGVTHRGNTVVLAEKDGRHANLCWLERGETQPLIIPLRFDLSRGQLTSFAAQAGSFMGGRFATTWLVPAENALLIGQAGTPGVWSIPYGDLRAAIDREKAAAKRSPAGG